MTISALPTVPDREALRALYDEAINEINQSRHNAKLTTDFYAKTGNGVFEAGYLALSDYCMGTKASQRLHVVSAPAGGGKTSFSYALILAVTRYAERTPDAPYGCAFVVDQITKADEVYRELNALHPGKVAIWTSDHDPGCAKPAKVVEPAARFTQDQLRHYPIIVVTHAFYNGARANKAHLMVRNGRLVDDRALVVVDERPEEVNQFEVLLSEAERVRENLQAKHPELKEHLDALMSCMEPYGYKPVNNLYRPTADFGSKLITEKLAWFAADHATDIAKSNAADIPGIEQLFGYARALTVGCAFVVPSDKVLRFVGYQRKLRLRAGMLLLDATADIDGVSHVVPWRQHVDVPKARYDNLEIIHVPQHTKKRLSGYLKTAGNQRAYAKWIVKTIREHMAPGERGLVVCKKALIEDERIPTWPEGDPRYETPAIYSEEFGWDLDGRKLSVIHWGTGVGSNNWQDADVVFLFDEFFIPRRSALATVQGLREHRADEGELASMNTLNSKARGVDVIAEGHRLRWTKQPALRGRGRSYDEHGVCGKQRLVVSSDLKSFMSSAGKLFPGAKITTVGVHAQGDQWVSKVIEQLGRCDAETITTKHLGQLLGKPWRELSSNVLKHPAFMDALGTLRWCYVTGRGRGGSRFERTRHDQRKQSELSEVVSVVSNCPLECSKSPEELSP